MFVCHATTYVVFVKQHTATKMNAVEFGKIMWELWHFKRSCSRRKTLEKCTGLAKIAATPATPLHFPLIFQRSYLDTVAYAGKSAPEKATDFAATACYKPLHFHSCNSSQHILNRFVENIGVIGFPDALRPISDALKSGYDALCVISDALSSVYDALLFSHDDLKSSQPSAH